MDTALFFKEMAALIPGEYLHVGGDENTGKHWNANPEIIGYVSVYSIRLTNRRAAG